MNKVVTRFAPSPTGSLHIGGIRTALYAYALAKKHKGKFILRIEDTDQTRKVEGAEQEIVEMLQTYGLNFDEKHKQTERKEIYQEQAHELVKKGKAYYCFASKAEIQKARELSESNGEIFRFRSPYRNMDANEALAKVEQGESYVIRLKVPENQEVTFEDGLQGKIKFNTSEVDDTVLLKSDGLPTYHLAVVIDDHLMQVSHVFRAVEWVPSIPKTVLIYRAFDWEMPEFYHVPLILDPEGGKLSKRKGSVAAKDFLKEGYVPEAVMNFLMLLGWSPPLEKTFGESEREIFSLEEFVDMFDLRDLNKSSGVFNREKLIWFNHQYLKNMPVAELAKKYGKWHVDFSDNLQLRKRISEQGETYLHKAIALVQDRLRLLSELDQNLTLFYFQPEKIDFSEAKQTKNLSKEQVNNILESFENELTKKTQGMADWPHEEWENFIRGLAEQLGVGAGKVFMTLRLAITGSEATPPLYEIMEILGKDEILTRLKRAG